jgi:hypothetical protein
MPSPPPPTHHIPAPPRPAYGPTIAHVCCYGSAAHYCQPPSYKYAAARLWLIFPNNNVSVRHPSDRRAHERIRHLNFFDAGIILHA